MSTRAELKAAATQVEHPWRTALRTAVQVGIPALLGLGVVVPEVISIVLEEFGESMPAAVRIWLLGAGALITSAAAVLTRIMAIPAVDAFLTRWGVGANPR